MFSRLAKFVKDCHILYDQQYGFRSKHSTQLPCMTGALGLKRGQRDISRAARHASPSCRAPREISRWPRLADKAPAMQAITQHAILDIVNTILPNMDNGKFSRVVHAISRRILTLLIMRVY